MYDCFPALLKSQITLNIGSLAQYLTVASVVDGLRSVDKATSIPHKRRDQHGVTKSWGFVQAMQTLTPNKCDATFASACQVHEGDSREGHSVAPFV
jgi:hypothetical protein